MNPPVARGTQGNKVVVRILPGLAAPLQVMNFNPSHRPTKLAPPAVPLENLPAKIPVYPKHQCEPDGRPTLANSDDNGFRCTSER